MTTRRMFIGQVAAAGMLSGSALPSSSATPVARQSDPEKGIRAVRLAGTDLSVSRIAYGCAALGGWTDAPLNSSDIQKADRVIHTAHDCGITLFDHADIYSFGRSEALFGEVLKQSPGLRAKLVIQSKCGQVLGAGWKPGDPVRANLGREHITEAVEGSLARLHTDRLDILLLHIVDGLMEPDEVQRVFEDLTRAGKVRYFGVSNYNSLQIQLLQKRVRQPIVVNQVHLGLGHPFPIADGMEFTIQNAQGQSAERESAGVSGAGTFDYCRLNNIQVQAYSPLRDVLTTQDDPKAEHRRTTVMLKELAAAKGVSPSAIALAWLLRHPAGIVPVIGSLEPKHIQDNCLADQVTLSRDEWYGLLAAAVELPSQGI